MKDTIQAFAPLLIWAVLIFVLSSIPDLALPTGFNLLDFLLRKGAHIFVYLVLFLFAWHAFRLPFPNSAHFCALVFCLLYAISDEIHQTFVLGRSGELRDVGFDLLGICLGYLLLILWQKHVQK